MSGRNACGTLTAVRISDGHLQSVEVGGGVVVAAAVHNDV